MTPDRKLSDNFSLYELTATNRADLQETNRELTDDQIDRLKKLARLLEHIRFVLGAPLLIHSGYRCPPLNAAVGSSSRSQHLLCEAADFIPKGLDLGESFRKVWKDIVDNGTNVGQLIHETAKRDYGSTSWIHVSLGVPFRDSAKCKQILRMENGVYTLLA